jgi:exodeoxyribonuclease VII large subunit
MYEFVEFSIRIVEISLPGMPKNILSELRTWRDRQARIEGVETFRVFPNAVLDAIAGALPQNRDEMMAIKGIKDAKYGKYGGVLLKIVAEHASGNFDSVIPAKAGIQKEKTWIPDQVGDDKHKGREEIDGQITDGQLPVTDTLSVTEFLDGLNLELSGMAARVKGEVTSVSERERWIYFSLKDTEGSTLSCLVSRYHYEISGVRLAEGDEIIVEGSPEIYKPMGKFSLKVSVIELAGEGALKKAYDALRKKLEDEGLFAPEKKRELPMYPDRIALITSKDGAAIDDFRMNLGMQGLRVDFYPTLVEGQRAVSDIISAIRFFNRTPEQYDMLVIVRGGGSLESLQAFNNEALVREVAESAIPTLLGVGHEKDVTLSALVADVMVSTPTATAKHVRMHLDEARQLVKHFEYQLPALFRERLSVVRSELSLDGEIMLARLRSFRDIVATLRQDIGERLVMTQAAVRRQIDGLEQGEKSLRLGFAALFERTMKQLDHAAERLAQYDPKRVLKLGYSLVQKSGVIMKSVSQARIGDILDVQLGDGKLQTKVEKVIES